MAKVAAGWLLFLAFLMCVLAISAPLETHTEYYDVNVGYRTGAVCRDGAGSRATGSGACSWHGGVAYWTFTERRSRKVPGGPLTEYTPWLWGTALTALAGAGVCRLWAWRFPPVRSVVCPKPAPPPATSHKPGHPEGPGPGACPRCRAPLVIRRRRSDGRTFLGCSHFPRCRYTRKIEHRDPHPSDCTNTTGRA